MFLPSALSVSAPPDSFFLLFQRLFQLCTICYDSTALSLFFAVYMRVRPSLLSATSLHRLLVSLRKGTPWSPESVRGAPGWLGWHSGSQLSPSLSMTVHTSPRLRTFLNKMTHLAKGTEQRQPQVNGGTEDATARNEDPCQSCEGRGSILVSRPFS